MKRHWKRYLILGLALLVAAGGALCYWFDQFERRRGYIPETDQILEQQEHTPMAIPESPDFPKSDTQAEKTPQSRRRFGRVKGYTPDPSSFARDNRSGREYVKNIIIVYFDAAATEAQRETARTSVKGKVVGSAEILGKWELEVRGESLDELNRLCGILSQMPGVVSAAPDKVLHVAPQGWPNDPWSSSGVLSEANRWWALADRLPEAWEYGSDAQVIMGMVDAGVDTGHPELSGIAETINTPGATQNHGTAVAGIMAAKANNGVGPAGVAWNAHIYVTDYTTAGGTSSQIVNGVADAVQRGAKAVNVSLGYIGASGYPNGLTDTADQTDEARTIAVALSQLINNGYGNFVVVQSAGNKDVPAVQNGLFASATLSPNNTGLDDIQAQKVCSRILTAGALAWAGGKMLNSASKASVYAPGDQMFLLASGGGYHTAQGTSFAAPQVTALAAWMLTMNPGLDGGQVGQLLRMPEISPDVNGLHTLDCRRALDQAYPAPKLQANAAAQFVVGSDYVTGINAKTKASNAEALLKNQLKALGGELNYPKAAASANKYAATGDVVTIVRPLGNNVHYVLAVKGDLNGDGRVDARDAQCLQNKQAGLWQAPYGEAAFQAAADFDGSGAVDGADAQAMFAEGMK